MGGAEGGKTVIRILCEGEKNLFSIKEKIHTMREKNMKFGG